MRTRTRNVVHRTYNKGAYTANAVHAFCVGSPPSSNTVTNVGAYGPIITKFTEERISDETGKGQPHAVIHRRLDAEISEYEDVKFSSTVDSRPCITTYTDPAPFWVDWNRSIYDAEMSWSVSNDATPPPNWTVNALTQDQDMDLRTSLLERARELKADALLNIVEGNQIWPAIRSLAVSLPQMRQDWRNIRKVIKTASGAYLAWKFGVSPILSDIMSINRYLPRMGRDIKRHAEQPTLRYSTHRELLTTFGPPYEWDISPYIRYSRQGLSITRPEVRYVLAVRPKTKYMSEFFNSLDLVLSRFATSPARLAWERIPFSFIADWFVDIKGCLNWLDKLVGQEPFEIKSFTRSYTYHLRTDRFVELKSSCSGMRLDTWKMATAEYKHYERSLVSGGAYAPRWKPRFGKNQAAISAALIAQMLLSSTRVRSVIPR
jgi:hypothetical protein